MSEPSTTVTVGIRPPAPSQRPPLAEVLNNADTSLRRDNHADEIGAMVWATIMHRRQQLGGTLPTTNDHRRAEVIKRVVMDATGEIVRSPLSHDANTELLEKMARAIGEQQQAG